MTNNKKYIDRSFPSRKRTKAIGTVQRDSERESKKKLKAQCKCTNFLTMNAINM